MPARLELHRLARVASAVHSGNHDAFESAFARLLNHLQATDSKKP